MTEKDITQIVVNGNRIGIVGLRAAAEAMGEPWTAKGDDAIRAELLRRLSEANYIPRKLMDDYGRALLREYKKILGMPVDEAEETPDGLEIRILGPGCARCDLMTKEVMAALSEMGVAAGVEHVTDIREIVKYRVMGSPALVINGRVVSVGQVPDRGTIKKWVAEAAAKGRGGSEEKPFRDRGR